MFTDSYQWKYYMFVLSFWFLQVKALKDTTLTKVEIFVLCFEKPWGKKVM